MYETRSGLSFLSSFQSAKVPIYACPTQNICSQHQIDWSPIQVYPKILRLVSRVNAKIFVGNGLHKNEEWIEITCNVSPPHRTEPNHAPSRFSITKLPTYNYHSTRKTSSSHLRNSDSSIPGSAPSSNISSPSSSPSGPAMPERASFSHR